MPLSLIKKETGISDGSADKTTITFDKNSGYYNHNATKLSARYFNTKYSQYENESSAMSTYRRSSV